jgi:hypothetical protein
MKNACTGRIVEREHCDDYMKYGDVIRETFSQHSPQYGLLPEAEPLSIRHRRDLSFRRILERPLDGGIHMMFPFT